MVNSSVEFKWKEVKWVALILFSFSFWTNSAFSKSESLRNDAWHNVKQQQTKKAAGLITDSAGVPLMGVNIVVKGTNIGVVSDFDGKFEIHMPSDKNELIFSYIGFKEQTLQVTESRNDITIVLQEQAQELEQVVVTALGIKREEKALSYNVQQVKTEELNKIKNANFVNSLSGKVAGVSINKSASGVGGATRVVMRGEKSIEGNNAVLYVVDGIPLFNTKIGDDSGIKGEGKVGSEGIADFNPEDIESISILSGPSAAALYGSSAANGVILINTKKGKEGKLQITYSTSAEFSQPFILPKFQNTYANRKGEYASWGDKLATPSSYDPAKDFFLTGANYINSLTLSTGTQQNQTFASVASTNSAGIVPNNTYDRFNVTIRNTSTFFNDKVQLDLGASYIKQKDQNMVSQGEYWNPIVAAYLYPRGEDFEKIKTFERYDLNRNLPVQYWPINEGVFAPQNPYWTAYRNLALNNKDRFVFNAGLTYKIADWFNIAARVRTDRSYIGFERKLYASSDEKFAKSKGRYDYSEFKDYQLYSDVIATINRRFDEFGYSINAGGSFSDYEAVERGYGGNLLLVPNLFSIQNINPSEGKISEDKGDAAKRNVAVFANLEFGYKNMLFLTFTGRNEWDSRLVNSAEESYFYPSMGVSAILSEMIKMPEFISFLKVRNSYTEVASPIAWSGRTPGTITQKIKGGVLQPDDIYPYSDFKAERTRSFEWGLNTRFLRNFSLDITYYLSNTYNQTFKASLPESTGFKEIYLQAGNVQNQGIEMSLGYRKEFNDFSVSSSVSFTHNKNEIKEMVKNYKHSISPNPFNISEVSKDNGRTILKEGGSISDIYASKFLKKDNQGFIYIPESGELSLENTPPVLLGKTTPDYTIGWSNSFRYKNFSLNLLISGRFGGVVTSSTQAVLNRFGVSETSALARDNGGVILGSQGKYDAKKYYELIGSGETALAGYYTYDATNIRLQEASLSFTFPKNWFQNKINELTVSLISSNLWMIYNKAPFDPELTPSTATYGQGNDYFMQPSLQSLGFSLKVKL
ncbi:SusC/RagA family TonB-linked outer membrane protein [Capnocytophaga sp.]|uniref:SusC/RagA family TonB-linked outer membrane protein n=1 Tax=Capnocytophaga sp. TaxID=44737 RepID=UPI0026DBA157|nr:SusC/RagA family TonB-linked outer membrane protein [Capnocytophaga sp.]MDO5104346.1 SusC/RagA family TonB-linked outer membrane protein [Capnocytophaga sp.]